MIAPEHVDFNASLAVRTDDGFFFGAGRSLHLSRLLAEIDTHLTPGDLVELRLTLAPNPGTALMRGRVLRGLVVAPGETRRWTIHVDEVDREDRPRLDAWLSQQLHGGTASWFEAGGSVTGMSQASPSDVRNALARMASRVGKPEAAPDSFGLRSDLTSDAGASKRNAMRDALRRAVSSPNERAAAPPPARPSLGAPPAPVSHAPAPRAAPPAAAPTRPTAEPAWSTFPVGPVTWMELRWETRTRFWSAIGELLATSCVRVAPDARALPGGAVHLLLRHDAHVLECDGNAIENGVYRITLDAAHHAVIADWAR